VGNERLSISVIRAPHSERLGYNGSRLAGGYNMAIAPTSEKYLSLRPKSKREADVMAFKLFCLFSVILVCLIMAGII
jgi:hypothetical protein